MLGKFQTRKKIVLITLNGMTTYDHVKSKHMSENLPVALDKREAFGSGTNQKSTSPEVSSCCCCFFLVVAVRVCVNGEFLANPIMAVIVHCLQVFYWSSILSPKIRWLTMTTGNTVGRCPIRKPLLYMESVDPTNMPHVPAFVQQATTDRIVILRIVELWC